MKIKTKRNLKLAEKTVLKIDPKKNVEEITYDDNGFMIKRVLKIRYENLDNDFDIKLYEDYLEDEPDGYYTVRESYEYENGNLSCYYDHTNCERTEYKYDNKNRLIEKCTFYDFDERVSLTIYEYKNENSKKPKVISFK